MSKRKKYIDKYKASPIQSIPKVLTLDDVDQLQQRLEIEKNLLLEKSLSSSDPNSILTAQKYLQNQKQSNDAYLKSFLFNPDIDSLNTNNFRVPTKQISYETLKRMARTPIIRIIIGTRVDQVAGFSEPQDNDQEKGWMIRKKKSVINSDKKEKPTTEELKKIEYITKFVQNGGTAENKWEFESLEEYLRQMANDSLTIDQLCVEMVNNRKGELVQYYPIDGSTIRLIDNSNEDNLKDYFRKVNNYFPKYVQVWQDQIHTSYYPWEMTFGVRNKVTDINANGYGISELEDMINVVTWMLYGMQYNGNFFSQGSNPKGFFALEGDLAPGALNDFKQNWRNTIVGVQNSHKVPVIGAGNAKIQWINMQTSNKDMEFNEWLEFLMVIGCAMFKIDPSECGFNLQKSSQIFGQDGQQERLKHSQTKGLVPILKLIQRLFTRYVVERLDEDYEFVFTGVETEDQEVSLKMDTQKITSGVMSLEDGFKKYSGRDFNPKKDTILNPVYLQIKQMQQFGGGGMNEEVNSQSGGGNPFEKKETESSPFEKSLNNYIESFYNERK